MHIKTEITETFPEARAQKSMFLIKYCQDLQNLRDIEMCKILAKLLHHISVC